MTVKLYTTHTHPFTWLWRAWNLKPIINAQMALGIIFDGKHADSTSSTCYKRLHFCPLQRGTRRRLSLYESLMWSLSNLFTSHRPGVWIIYNTISAYKTNTQITMELKITPILDKLLEYKRKWIQHVNRVPRNRLPRVMKHFSPTGRRNHDRPMKRLLDMRDRNRSTRGSTPWQIYDDDESHDPKWVPSFISRGAAH